MVKTTNQNEQETDFEHIPKVGDTEQVIEEKYKPMERKENTEDTHVAILRKVLGQELAEYFLSPALPVPSSTLQLGALENEVLNARDLWRHLREQSEAQLSQHVSMLPGKHSVGGSCFCASWDYDGSRFCASWDYGYIFQVDCWLKWFPTGLVQAPSSTFSGRLKQFKGTLDLMCHVSESNQDKALFILANISQSGLDKLRTEESLIPYLFEECIENKKEIESEKQFHIKPLIYTKNLMKKNKSQIQKIKVGNKSYRLATEETFISEGEFSKRLHDRREGNQRLIVYNENVYINHSSFPAYKEESSCEQASGHGPGDIIWEPLTYTALMEYRPSVTVSGKGAFRSGQASQWFVRSAIINHKFS